MTVTPIVAIKKYFFGDTPLKECLPELKALSQQERAELAQLCAVELDCELIQLKANK
uniref:Uncharacterized protein n=1 Tax=viral metagenome TaxID=1070528 RepID=A0A6H2A3S2_9ZZZZ